MKKTIIMFICIAVSLLAGCTFHYVNVPDGNEGDISVNQITLPEEATGLLSEVAKLWKEWKTDKVGDLEKLFTAKEQKNNKALEASEKENKSLLERIRSLESSLNSIYTSDPGTGETGEVTFDEGSAIKEKLRFHGYRDSGSSMAYGKKDLSRYPPVLRLECANGFSRLINHGNKRYEKGGVIVKQSDVSDRGLAVIMAKSLASEDCWVLYPDKNAIAENGADANEKVVYENSKEFDTARGHGSDNGRRDGFAVIEGSRQKPFDSCVIDGHTLPVHAAGDSRRHLWNVNLKISEGTVVCERDNEIHHIVVKKGCVHRGKYRDGGIKDEC